MADCKFQLRLTIVGLLLVALAIEYAMVVTASVGTDPRLAADGDEETCTETSEWKLDFKDYVIIENVSIHTETVPPISQWVTSAASSRNPEGYDHVVLGRNGGLRLWCQWIEVEFAEKVMMSKVDIYGSLYPSSGILGVGHIKCYVDGGWKLVWSAASAPSGTQSGSWEHEVYSPNLTESCFSNRIRLEGFRNATGNYSFEVDAVNVHGRIMTAVSAGKPFTIAMGLTEGKNEVESTMNLSTYSPTTWSPDDKGPYRYVQIQANETLKLCEVKIESYPQPRTPSFQIITGIAMSNPPVRTVSNVVSNIVCAFTCLRQTDPACVTAKFDEGTQTCALFVEFLTLTEISKKAQKCIIQ